MSEVDFEAWRAGRTGPEDELRLVWGCARGERSALEHLEREFLAALGPAIARVDRSPAFRDEVLQRLRTRLLVPVEGVTRLESWEGTAPLAGWLRAVAVRVALNLKRDEGARAPDDDEVLETVSTSGPEPELALLRAQHQALFGEAFREAIASLEVRERTALRLQVVDGLTLEQIGALYRVNKSTVSRWLTAAHASIGKRVRRRLAEALRVEPTQLDSVVRALQSNLELSLSSVLGAA